ncbi:Imm50 family immunity protein [Streptomyces sp. NPDC006335]|uniref:Imm50 family immunity protein n=1 Tax=Streptomyces sp. NPDC006335 TaxID=3156895 RepID=UPI0033A09695
MLDWIAALSNPQPILAVYGEAVPTLDDVRIEELCLSVNGPVLRLRFDLAEFPVNPPVKWRRDGLDVVQVEISFGGVRAISVDQFSTDSICDLKIRKDGLIAFSSESDSVHFEGLAETATILRISAYAMDRA